MPSTHPQYDEVSQEDQKANQRLSGSLNADSPESSKEHPYDPTTKIAPGGGPQTSYALLSDHVGSAGQQEGAARKIHWVSPTMMVVSLLCGVALAIGHHYYYSNLNDEEVGSSEKQQWSLRFGNAFAVSTSLCLKTAVGIAYLQVLWRRLSKSDTSIRTIDSSFDISGNVLSFFNLELWKKMQIGVALALLLWCLPIPTLLAPPTLSVHQKPVFSFQILPVLTLDILDIEQFTFLQGEEQEIELTATPQLKSVAAMVAYGGNILSFDSPSPAPNSSYEVTSYAPLVRCRAANETEQSRLLKGATDMGFAPPLTTNHSTKWSSAADFNSGEIGYLAVYDEHNNVTLGEKYAVYDNVTDGEVKYPIYDSILVALQRKNTTSKYQSDTEYISCSLWNSTLKFSINIVSGRSRVENITTTWENPINASVLYDDNYNTSNPMAYLSYFSAVTNYIIGRGQYITSNYSNTTDNFTMAGEVFGSTLSFNSQFRAMTMDIASHLDEELTPRITKSENLRNTSFSHDLEQLALNTSISLYRDSQFCKYNSTNVTSQTTLTVYTYQSRNLFIAYGLAILFSALSVGLGLYSMYRNGASYDASFSSISVAMQNEKVIKVLEQANATTAQPLNKQAGTIRLRFRPREGFIANDVQRRVPY